MSTLVKRPNGRSRGENFLKASAGAALIVGAGPIISACGKSTAASSGSPSALGSPKRGGTFRVGCTGGGAAESFDPGPSSLAGDRCLARMQAEDETLCPP